MSLQVYKFKDRKFWSCGYGWWLMIKMDGREFESQQMIIFTFICFTKNCIIVCGRRPKTLVLLDCCSWIKGRGAPATWAVAEWVLGRIFHRPPKLPTTLSLNQLWKIQFRFHIRSFRPETKTNYIKVVWQ